MKKLYQFVFETDVYDAEFEPFKVEYFCTEEYIKMATEKHRKQIVENSHYGDKDVYNRRYYYHALKVYDPNKGDYVEITGK